MRLIESLSLGNRCLMHLVRLGKREILIGVDGAGIKTVVPLAGTFEDVLEANLPREASLPLEANHSREQEEKPGPRLAA
jgi:hypothetical protein